VSKEIWFKHYERRLNERLEQGYGYEQAEEVASREAMADMKDELAEQVDRAWDEYKHEVRSDP
jgi:hypothetical protein